MRVVVRLHGMTSTMEKVEVEIPKGTRFRDVILKAIDKGLCVSIPEPSTPRGMARYAVMVDDQLTSLDIKVESNCEIAIVPIAAGG